jgi:O-antigen/teichoic acid export membrane protein
VFVTFRYEVAILRSDNLKETKSLLIICLLINAAVAALVLVIIVFLNILGPIYIVDFVNFPLWLIPLVVMIGGVAQTFGFIAIRESDFSTSANSRIAQSSGYAASAAFIGAVKPVVSGLILADIVGRLTALFYLTSWMKRQPIFAAARGNLRETARKYREYPLFALPGTLINTLGGVLTPIMVYAGFSASVSGQFGLVERSLSLPLSLVVSTVAQVYTARLAASKRDGAPDVVAQFRRLIGVLALLAIGPVFVLLFFGPWLFQLVFGPTWIQAGHFAQIMAPAYGILLVSGAINMTLTVSGFQRTQIAWEAFRLLAMIALWTWVTHAHIAVETAVIGHSAVLAFTSLLFIVLADRALAKQERGR